MLRHARWIDYIGPGGEEGLLGDGNPARDSLRAILVLTLFGLTFTACMVRYPEEECPFFSWPPYYGAIGRAATSRATCPSSAAESSSPLVS